MKEIDHIYKALQQISPEIFGQLLVREGFVLRKSISQLGDVYNSADGVGVLIPTNKKAADFPDAILDLSDTIKNILDVSYTVLLERLSLPDYHVFQNRVLGPDNTWGTMKYYSFELISNAMFNVVRYSAAGLFSDAILPGLNDAAKSYSKLCRIGQTEVGSYTIKLLCPSNPLGIVSVNQDEEFGTTALKASMENFEFLSSEESDDPDVQLPRSMNARVAKAISNLRPSSEFGENEISTTLMPKREVRKASSTRTIRVNKFAYARAHKISDRLTKSDDYELMNLEGVITDLHMDRPRKDFEITQSITMEIAPNWRKLIVGLLPDEFKRASDWQLEKRNIRISGLVDKRGKVWRVVSLRKFDVIKKDGFTLFD